MAWRIGRSNRITMKKRLFRSLLLLLGFIFWVATSFAQQHAHFQLPNIHSDNPFNSGSLSDAKALVVVFTSAHCAYATNYEDRLKEFHSAYAPKGVEFVAINSNDGDIYPEDALEELKKQTIFPFPYLKDESQHVAKSFGATYTPEVFLLTPDAGGWVVRYSGSIDDLPIMMEARVARQRYLAEAINQLLAGQPLSVSRTDPTGCQIVWKEE